MRTRLRRAVERHPLLWVAAAAVAGVLVADGFFLPGAICGLLVFTVLFRAGLTRITAAAVVLSAAAGSLHGWRKGPQDTARTWVTSARVSSAEISARVLSAPKANAQGWSALVAVHSGGPAGKVSWWGRGEAPPRGAEISSKGRFRPFPEQRNPGTFDVASWLYRLGAWGIFEAEGPARIVSVPSAFDLVEEQTRNGFRHAVTAGLDPVGREAAVIRAMVIGDNPDGDEALIDAYRASGTLHVFSVSGMHVAMVGVIGWFLLKLLGVPRRSAVILILLGMLGYAWVTGMKPPAVRSVVMAAALLGAFLTRRRPDLLNALGFALLAAVITNGHLIFQAGVQLSFGVVFAIGMGTALASKAFTWISVKEPYLPRSLYGWWRERWLRFREKTVSALGASTVASVGSVPLTLGHFGFLAPISILASPIIGLPVFALMSLALLAVVLSPFPSVQRTVNRLNGGMARLCTGVADTFARIPGGNFTFARDRPGTDFLLVFDPGYGGGAAVLHDRGSTILIDAASRAGFRSVVQPSLEHLALVPDSIVLSHPDGGHIGGALDALEPFPIRQILLPVARARSSVFRDIMKTAEQKRIPAVLPSLGSPYSISQDTWLEVLHLPPPLEMNTVADERVMVCRLHWHGWRVLFLSDAGWTTERALLESGLDLSADVIVAGRHRHDSSMGDDFLAAVKPRAIVASHTDFPSEERIPPRWAAHCEEIGIHLFHQGKTGAVSLALGAEGSLELRGFLDHSELRLRRLPQP